MIQHKIRTRSRLATFCCTVVALQLMLWSKSFAENHWFTSVYGGQFSNTALLDIVQFSTSFEGSWVMVLSAGRTLATYREAIRLEVEGQAGIHAGLQDHAEINAAFVLRWLPFPWDSTIDTSVAFGNGVSYATEDPELEIRESDDDRTSQWLYYILVELAFSLPDRPRWDLFMRVHHRSSVFGAIDSVVAGSNFVGLGIRYRF